MLSTRASRVEDAKKEEATGDYEDRTISAILFIVFVDREAEDELSAQARSVPSYEFLMTCLCTYPDSGRRVGKYFLVPF